MSSIHNPSQFEPADYSVIDYFDNKPPAFNLGAIGEDSTGRALEYFNADRQRWMETREKLFPESNCYQCQHCGQGNVRWVTAVLHKPTGKHICFGAECTARLGFASANDFRLAQVKSRAEAGHARMLRWLARERFLKANAEVVALIEQAKAPLHANNAFVQDVLSKLDLWGNLSVAQVTAVRNSLARDIQKEKDRVNDTRSALVTSPRALRTGTIISQKTKQTDFGTQFKMLVELEDGNRIYGTEPSAIASLHVGDKISFCAPVEVSQNDVHFGFFSRPTKTQVLVKGPRSLEIEKYSQPQ